MDIVLVSCFLFISSGRFFSMCACGYAHLPLQTHTLKKPVMKSWSAWLKIRKPFLKTVQTGAIWLLSDQHEGSCFSSYFKTGTSQNSEMLISMSHYLRDVVTSMLLAGNWGMGQLFLISFWKCLKLMILSVGAFKAEFIHPTILQLTAEALSWVLRGSDPRKWSLLNQIIPHLSQGNLQLLWELGNSLQKFVSVSEVGATIVSLPRVCQSCCVLCLNL